MTDTKTIKDIMLSEIRSLRHERATEDYQVFNSPEMIMDSMARMWQKWDFFAKTMSLDFHISYEEAVRICAITEELGLAVNYAENCDTKEALEIIPYLSHLTAAGCEMIDMVRTRLPEEQAEQTATFLQLQSIISSLYKHILTKCLATRRTLTLLCGGRGLIELAGEESVQLPDSNDLAAAEILEEFDCEMDCQNCRRDSGQCSFFAAKGQRESIAAE